MAATMSVSESLNHFHDEDWDAFKTFESDVEKKLNDITRKVPPGLSKCLQSYLLHIMLECKEGSIPAMRQVIDANIIVMDSIRVGKGKPSSTGRILASPNIQVLAPDIIQEEAHRNIKKKLKDPAQRDAAIAHANDLLSSITKTSDVSSKSICRAQQLIASHSPEDVPFLALAIESNADGIISRDKRAFDAQPEIKRWNLGETAELITIYESGALSLIVLGHALEGLISLFEKLIVIVLQAFVKTIEMIVAFIKWIAEGISAGWKKLPDWAKAIIIGTCAGIIIGMIVDADFRKSIFDKLSRAGEVLASIVEHIVAVMKKIWDGIKDILNWIWGLVEPAIPYIVTIVGVMCRRIFVYLTETQFDPDDVNSVALFKRLNSVG